MIILAKENSDTIYLNKRRMECKPEDAVFIDDVVINLEGAAKLGITPILITRGNAPKTKEDFVTIKTLEELIK